MGESWRSWFTASLFNPQSPPDRRHLSPILNMRFRQVQSGLIVLYLTSILATASSPARTRRSLGDHESSLEKLASAAQATRDVKAEIVQQGLDGVKEIKDKILEQHRRMTDVFLDEDFLAELVVNEEDASTDQSEETILTRSLLDGDQIGPDMSTVASNPAMSEVETMPPSTSTAATAETSKVVTSTGPPPTESTEAPSSRSSSTSSTTTTTTTASTVASTTVGSSPGTPLTRPEDLTMEEEEEEEMKDDMATLPPPVRGEHCHFKDVKCLNAAANRETTETFKARSDNIEGDCFEDESETCNKKDGVDRVLVEINVEQEEDQEVEAESKSIFDFLKSFWTWF